MTLKIFFSTPDYVHLNLDPPRHKPLRAPLVFSRPGNTKFIPTTYYALATLKNLISFGLVKKATLREPSSKISHRSEQVRAANATGFISTERELLLP